MGDLPLESFGSCLLLFLPEDVIAVIARFVSPRDVCNLSLCCKSLCDLLDSERIWLAQCEVVKVLPLSEIVQWRVGISSYKALCRFLVDVMKPLVGIWVHQNPELGNVVYVMPGFLSVVGCRIILQEVGPLGIHEAQVMWSPVFEIICGLDGSAMFFLHGKDVNHCCCLHPGFVTGIEKSCNVLLLEVEPRQEKLCSDIEKEVQFPFCKLPFSHRRNLLHIVTSTVGLPLPDLSSERLFPKSKEDEPGKALFLLLLSYTESQDGSERLLIGTKILEGTHYGMHPNGSAMFVVKIDSPCFELFPFDTNGEEFEHSYEGEGTSKGYGFRYPGYKPGNLFVTSKGLLMFVWKATKVVLTLQRLDLGELLRNGMCVSPLPPCLNFVYLTKSHTNVFAPERRRS